MPGFPLFGREREIEVLDDLLARAEAHGSSLLIRGEAGIGKSALLREARRSAGERGIRVLATTGVQSEAHLPYAGLHQLLRPELSKLDQLPAPQRRALLGAFGIDEADTSVFLTGLATLTLLSETASETPVLLVLEDAHWLDPASSEVLAFVARRLESDRIVLLAASRAARDDPLTKAGLPELPLGPLDEPNAAALLDAQAQELPAAVRKRVLQAAAGNPLALVELPIAWASQRNGRVAPLPTWLPLTTRLEHAFSARVAELPAATRTVLLVAALDEEDLIPEILGAAVRILGGEVTVELLEPALSAGLVLVEHDKVSFRHPLMRSAIRQAASLSQRYTAHAALAEVLVSRPDRRLWHLAASSVGPNEELARELEDAAASTERRGAIGAAAAALERAAQLSLDPVTKGRRLLTAAQFAQELGHRDIVLRLIDQADPLELAEPDRTRLLWLREELDDSAWSGAARIRSFVKIADRFSRDGEPERALRCLLTVALRMWWSNPSQEMQDLVVETVERLHIDDHNPALLAILSYADPVKRGAQVIERISRMRPETAGDPAAMYLVGSAATGVWAHDLALSFLGPAVDGLRAQGRLGLLAQALVSQAWAALLCGKETLAASAADEAARLADESGQPRWAIVARLAQATVLGNRGDFEAADRLLRGAEATLMQAGAHPILALAQFARGSCAVAHQRYEDGYHHLSRLFIPDDIAYHPYVGAWALADLVEAAVHLGRDDSAAAHLAQLESLAAATAGSLLEAQLRYARPLVADDDRAEDLYQAALDSDLTHWPSHRGRLLLSYGRWLRRRRRVAESRAPLRAARETFDALAFRALSDASRQELRASGETSRRRAVDARDQLTPQELQIAHMAAAGLSNKEIGQKLYLSHRTVGSHLYRMFPKLGISSRSQLRDVLPAADTHAVSSIK